MITQTRDSDAPYNLVHREHVHIYSRSRLCTAVLIKICRDESKHVYCAGWSDSGYLLLVFVLKMLGFKTTVGMDNQFIGGAKQKLFTKFGLGWVLTFLFDTIWVPGIRQQQYASMIGFKKERIHLGLYVASSHFRRDIGLDLRSNHFVSTGRLVEYKNFELLIRSFSALVKTRNLKTNQHKLSLTIIGSGPQESYLMSIVQSLEMSDFIQIVPFVQPLELLGFYEGKSLFILLSEVEAHGLVVHEAGCLGLPILVSSGVGAGDLFVNEHSGIIVKSLEIEFVVKAMSDYINRKIEERTRMSYNSKILSEAVTTDAWIKTIYAMRSRVDD